MTNNVTDMHQLTLRKSNLLSFKIPIPQDIIKKQEG